MVATVVGAAVVDGGAWVVGVLVVSLDGTVVDTVVVDVIVEDGPVVVDASGADVDDGSVVGGAVVGAAVVAGAVVGGAVVVLGAVLAVVDDSAGSDETVDGAALLDGDWPAASSPARAGESLVSAAGAAGSKPGPVAVELSLPPRKATSATATRSRPPSTIEATSPKVLGSTRSKTEIDSSMGSSRPIGTGPRGATGWGSRSGWGRRVMGTGRVGAS